jgi:hypothetical protein
MGLAALKPGIVVVVVVGPVVVVVVGPVVVVVVGPVVVGPVVVVVVGAVVVVVVVVVGGPLIVTVDPCPEGVPMVTPISFVKSVTPSPTGVIPGTARDVKLIVNK